MAEHVSTDQPPEPVAQADSHEAQATHGPYSDSSHDPPGSDGEDASDSGGSHEGADQGLHTEVMQLRRAMQTRPPIDKAMGVLMAAHGLSEEEAWKILVTVSQHTNTKLYAVAGEIVASTQTQVVDPRLRRMIAAALKELKAR